MADIRSVSNSSTKAPDEYVEQIRQKIGTEFSDRKISGKKKNELGKDDFIKLMSAQLKHQDPLSPVKNEQMAAQLAQFSALEQMVNVNTNLEKMAAGQRPQENLLAASLIGKKVMTDSSRFHLQKGAQSEVKFDLPQDAKMVNVSMVDAKGEIVREFELGSMTKGPQSLRWDGKNSKSLEVAPGEYSYRVNALDHQGVPLQISTTTAGLVTGVSFEGGKAQLLVEGKRIPIESVGRIEAEGVSQATAEKSPPEKGSDKVTQQAKNNLPVASEEEKMKSMLEALASLSRKESEPSAVAEDNVPGDLPMPLWNPSSL